MVLLYLYNITMNIHEFDVVDDVLFFVNIVS